MIPPAQWVTVHLDQIPRSGRVLDLACGQGRHARLLALNGHAVLAVDRNTEALAALADAPRVETRCLDLECDRWPLDAEAFAGIVVTNYLWRPHLDQLPAMLQPGGVLIYETFMVGQQRLGKPSNPQFLLAPGELQHWAARHALEIIAYREGESEDPVPAVKQALCARRSAA